MSACWNVTTTSLSPSPVMSSYGDEDLDAALALVCDGALSGDHAAHAPVVARDVIAAVAAGGQAQAKQKRKQRREEMME